MYSMAKLNVRTVQISCIENVHSCHYIHDNVKPTNFLMGLGIHENKVYIIDFGPMKMYRDWKTHLHIPYKENCHPIGTPPFASINNHLGVEQSRHDNMEPLTYILIYFLCGSLPWSGIKLAMDMKWHKETLQWKMGSPLDLLGSAYPNKFSVFLSYTRALCFDEKPDYTYICKIFCELLLHTEYQHLLTCDSPDACIAGARAKNNKWKVQWWRIWDASMTGWLSLTPITCRLCPCTHSCIPSAGTSDTAYLPSDTFILLCVLAM